METHKEEIREGGRQRDREKKAVGEKRETRKKETEKRESYMEGKEIQKEGMT